MTTNSKTDAAADGSSHNAGPAAWIGRRWRAVERGTQRLIGGQRGLWGVGFATFLESTVLPVPIELFLFSAYLADQRRAWTLATAALAGSLVGAALFYGLGAWLYDSVGTTLIAQLGLEQDLKDFQKDMQDGGFWLIFSAALLPVPLQVATLGSGALSYPFLPFLAAIGLSRFCRFHGLAALTKLAGQRIRPWLANKSPVWRAGAFFGSILILLAIGYALVRVG